MEGIPLTDAITTEISGPSSEGAGAFIPKGASAP